MDVTRLNFQEVMEELDSVLKDATFLAIDTEFTGLNSGPEAKPFDTPAEYYAKLNAGSSNFLLVQFGLSVFTYNPQNDKYTQQSYNFYVFPRPLNRLAPDSRFMCQASSIAFLADNGFDFNKLFNLGIPYLTFSEKERLEKKLNDRPVFREDGLDIIPIPDDDKMQIEETCSKIEEFLNSDAEVLSTGRCNAFIRRLIHQEARARWPKQLRLESKNDRGMDYMMVYKLGTKEEESVREAERLAKEKKEMSDAMGLTTLLLKIAKSGKTIVGHNMLLDLFHMIHQFFGPLPENYSLFKEMLHDLFPRLFDTKVVCKAPQLEDKLPSSVLDQIFETVRQEPFTITNIEPVEGRSYPPSCEKFHEAGYDSYVTGLCFIALSNYIGRLENLDCSTVLCDSPVLNPYLNKLTLVRLRDIPHIDLDGSDPEPRRDHVFHLTFPSTWKWGNILRLFAPFGGVYISWLNDTSAYVMLHKREHSSTVMGKLSKDPGIKNFKIQTYENHKKSVEGTKKKSPLGTAKTTTTTPPTRKNISDRETRSSANAEASNESEDVAVVWEKVPEKKRRKRKAAGHGENENDASKDGPSTKKTFSEDPTWE